MPEPEQAAFPVPSDWLGLGLTKRELVAIAIAQGLAATPYKYAGASGILNTVSFATDAIAIADELLTQLETNEQTDA